MPRVRASRRQLGMHAVLTGAALLMTVPFLWQIVTSLKTLGEATRVPPTLLPAEPQWQNFERFFTTMPIGSMFTNSIIALILRVTGQLLFASLAAFAFSRLEFRGRDGLFYCFLVVLMIPPQLFVIPQYELMRTIGWLDSVQALAVPGMFSSFGVFLLRQFMLTIPKEYDEAAKLDGVNPLQTYRHVIMPLCGPALAALAILTSLFSWNDLLWPLIVNTSPDKMTLPVGLASLQGLRGTDYPVLMAGSLITLAPLVVIFLLLQKQFIRGVAMSGIKG